MRVYIHVQLGDLSSPSEIDAPLSVILPNLVLPHPRLAVKELDINDHDVEMYEITWYLNYGDLS